MKTIEILGEKAEYYLSHVCRTIDKSQLYLPAPDTVDKVWIESDRNIRTLGSLQWILYLPRPEQYFPQHDHP